MADLTITAASVVADSMAVKETGVAGATITAGQTVYKSSTTNKFLLADSDSATAEVRVPYGIALNGASDGQPLVVAKSGDVTLGAVMTAAASYWQSNTPGGICPDADVGAAEYATFIGVAKSTSVLSVAIKPSGVAR